MSPLPNLYALLGLTRDATPEEIRRAYHESARRLHPDVSNEVGATELFLRMQDAYETLSDREKRNQYDASYRIETTAQTYITVKTLYSRPALLRIDEPQLIYILLELSPGGDRAVAAGAPSKPPLNVSLVLDRSTSMQGERMDTVKATAIEIIRQLEAEDILSIVIFSDRAEVLQPASSQKGRDDVETKIRMVTPGGGTELLRGLEAGYFEVRRNLSKSCVNHLILLTDGHTYGDEEACLGVARLASENGIGVTAFGIGSEWNDVFLDSLTTKTGGRSLFVSRPDDIRNYLKEKFHELNQTYAEGVTLDLATRPGVQLLNTYRLQPNPTPLPAVFPIHLGSISRNACSTVLLEFSVSPLPSGIRQFLIASGELTSVIPGLPDPSSSQYLDLHRPISQDFIYQATPRAILQAMSQITLYRMQERARQEAASGNIAEASHRLKGLATHLLAQGKGELAQTILMEAEHLRKVQAFSEEGEKRIKYGTRALLLPASTPFKNHGRVS